MKVQLTIDDLTIIKWWIDESHNVHLNMKGHTGGMMSLEEEDVANYSHKHKINTQSSTKSEIVSVDQHMPEIC